VLVHGDLHIRHLLVDAEQRLTGVIDWGDLCLADRSVDLSIVWSFLPPDGRSAFAAEYGSISDETALRARMLAVHLTASIAHQAHLDGMALLEREALAGLSRAAAG
jgi:aminoglycoside phosphotransferase (APT) family kinase protein